MENLNAEQIKGDLECCAYGDCKDCTEYSNDSCGTKVLGGALELIKSQEQRIKELAEENEKLKKAKYIFSTVDYCADDLAKALEENKKLTEENERLSLAVEMDGFSIRNRLESIERYCNEKIKIAQADTVRKMHSEIKERCIKGGIYPAFVASTIDQIAKEIADE